MKFSVLVEWNRKGSHYHLSGIAYVWVFPLLGKNLSQEFALLRELSSFCTPQTQGNCCYLSGFERFSNVTPWVTVKPPQDLALLQLFIWAYGFVILDATELERDTTCWRTGTINAHSRCTPKARPRLPALFVLGRQSPSWQKEGLNPDLQPAVPLTCPFCS